MIDRISSVSALQTATAAAAKLAGGERAVTSAMAESLAGGNPIGTPLREIAGTTASALGGGDPVSAGRLERAALDFGREVKAFAIGHADRGHAAVQSAIAGAIDQGAADVERLSGISLNTTDRAVALFERAAHHLSQSADGAQG